METRTIPLHKLIRLRELASRADNAGAVRLLDKLIEEHATPRPPMVG